MESRNPNQSVTTRNHLNKADKVIRYFHSRRVELPVKEKVCRNKVVMNPPETSNGSYIQGYN